MNQTKTEWNTGRSYTSEGQVIRAIFTPVELDDDNYTVVGSLDFADISRNISGRFDRVCFLNDGWENEDGTYPELVVTEKDLQKETLRRYDEGGYDSSQLFDAHGKTVNCHFCGAKAEGEYSDDEGEVCNTCESKYGEKSPLIAILPDPDCYGGSKQKRITADTPVELAKAVRAWVTETCYGASDIGALFNVYRVGLKAPVATIAYNSKFIWRDPAHNIGDVPKPTGAQILNSDPLTRLRYETLSARTRTGKLIAVGVEAGKYQVQEIIPKGRTSDVIPLSEFVSIENATTFLERL